MPSYIGLPIAIILWVVVAIASIIFVICIRHLYYSIIKYNDFLDKAVKRELAKIKIQENNKEQ